MKIRPAAPTSNGMHWSIPFTEKAVCLDSTHLNLVKNNTPSLIKIYMYPTPLF